MKTKSTKKNVGKVPEGRSSTGLEIQLVLEQAIKYLQQARDDVDTPGSVLLGMDKALNRLARVTCVLDDRYVIPFRNLWILKNALRMFYAVGPENEHED